MASPAQAILEDELTQTIADLRLEERSERPEREVHSADTTSLAEESGSDQEEQSGATAPTAAAKDAPEAKSPGPVRAESSPKAAAARSGKKKATAASPDATGFRDSSGHELSSLNVYIRGLPAQMTDDWLLSICKTFGEVVSAKAVIDFNTCTCKGLGFVMFKTSETAIAAMKHLNATGYTACFARRCENEGIETPFTPTDLDPTNVYFCGLPGYFTEQHLSALVKPLSAILSARIMFDSTGLSRGLGFVRVLDPESAQRIIEAFHNTVLPGTTIPLTCRLATAPSALRKRAEKPRPRAESQSSQQPQGPFAYSAHSVEYNPYPFQAQQYAQPFVYSQAPSYGYPAGVYASYPSPNVLISPLGPIAPVLSTDSYVVYGQPLVTGPSSASGNSQRRWQKTQSQMQQQYFVY